MESHAAAMIKRFREGKPMSKIEREKLKQEEREEEKRNEMWWIDKKLENTDDIKPRPSPLKPMRNDIPYDPINTFDSPLKPARFDNLRKPISPPRRFDNYNNYNNYNRQNKNEFNFSTRKSQGIDDLITDDIDDSILEQYRIPDLESPSPFSYNNNHNLIKNNNNNNNKSINNNNNNNNNKEYSQSIDDLLALLRVTKEEKQRLQGKEKSLKFQNSTKYDEDDNDNDLDLYRSYEINRQPIDPIDNFGTKSFKSLLIPSMKLDGKIEKNEPKTPDNKAELVHLTTNLEGLLQSFNINRNSEENIPNTEYDVPQTITQVTNTLNSEMLKFTSHYKAKYENEELLEKSQKKRDEEMKAIGKQEAQSKLIMDSKYFSLHCDELTDYYGLESVYSGDEKILESIENSIKKRNLKVNQGKNKYNEKEEEQEEEENGENNNNNNNYKSNNKKLMKENSSNYRHHLYDNQQYIRGYDRDVNLSDLSSNINLRRMESLYLLHRLDPPLPQYKYHNYHYEENNIDDEMNKKRHNEDLNDEYELSLRGIDILSQNDVKHRSITSAARDTITCCLNATINTLNLRLPSEDEIKRQESIENELKIKYDEETKKLNDELNSVKQELEKKEQELLEKIKESSSPSSPLPPPYSVEDPYFNNINNNSNNQLIIEKKENNFKNSVTKDDLDKLDKLLGPDNKESDLLKDVLKNKINIEDKQEQKQPQGKNKIYFQTINDIEHQISHRGNEPTKHIQKFINTSTITKPEKTQPSAPFIPIDKVPLPPNKTIDREVLSNDTKSLDISRHEREAYLQKMKSLRKQLMT